MATQPKSKAVEEYRRQIAAYLEAVKITTGWKNVRLGKEAGDLSHTTIGRALKRDHTLGFPALLALEAASGVKIPDSLRGAAIAAQQPTRPEETALRDRISAVVRDLEGRPKAEQDAILKELREALAKAS